MLDWDDLRFLLAVARRGSLSSAAKALGVTQPTVGRRIAAFEGRLGTKLFAAVPGGQALTSTGKRLLVHAERIELEALAAESAGRGRDADLSGAVCVTASEWLIDRVLAPLVVGLLRRHPRLEIELVGESRHANLLKREADLALRPSRFEHGDVVERLAGEVAFDLYASDAYLAEHGAPRFDDGGSGLRVIAMSTSLTKVPDVEWLARALPSARVVARANGRLPMATMAAAGLGLAVLPRFVGDATPGLRRCPTPVAGPRRQLWLATHADARSSRRVRVTRDHLMEGLMGLRHALAPA